MNITINVSYFFFYLIFYKGPWQPSLIRNIPKELRHCAKPTAVSPRLLTTFVNSFFADFALACILTKIQVGVLVVISTYANLFLSLIKSYPKQMLHSLQWHLIVTCSCKSKPARRLLAYKEKPSSNFWCRMR